MSSRRMWHVAGRMISQALGRSNDTAAVLRAVARQARASLDDEAAKTALGLEISGHRRGVTDALDVLRKNRADFLADRAFRLLDAAARDAPVAAIATDKVEMFAREEELGRMSVAEAYARLAEMAPRLKDLAEREAGDSDGQRAGVETNERGAAIVRLRGLVGPGSQHPDSLMHTQLALSIAVHYLAIVSGRLPLERKSEPYFSARRRVVVRSGVLTGPDLQSPSL